MTSLSQTEISFGMELEALTWFTSFSREKTKSMNEIYLIFLEENLQSILLKIIKSKNI